MQIIGNNTYNLYLIVVMQGKPLTGIQAYSFKMYKNLFKFKGLRVVSENFKVGTNVAYIIGYERIKFVWDKADKNALLGG